MNFPLYLRRSTRLMAATIAVACSFLCAGSLRLQAQTSAPQVKIDTGTLQGAWGSGASHVAAFLGVPYAAQPVDNLRWKAPQPPPSWPGIREAIKYGPACPQTPSPWLPEMLGIQKMETNEACLYLNVWTPNLRLAAKLPVMVWIHGGGNVEGAANWPPLGSTLAHEGVVVVSLNYRLGVFGFFAYPRWLRNRRIMFLETTVTWIRCKPCDGSSKISAVLAATPTISQSSARHPALWIFAT